MVQVGCKMWTQNRDYLLIDDFLDDEHFQLAKNINLEPADKETKIYSSYIDLKTFDYETTLETVGEDGPIDSQVVEKEKNLVEYVIKDYYGWICHYYNELKSRQNKPIDKFSTIRWGIVNSGKNFNYKVHNDAPYKKLSIVVYLSDENTGTHLHDTDGNLIEECEWVQNRAFIFSRGDDTLHSYRSNGRETRKTLMINIL